MTPPAAGARQPICGCLPRRGVQDMAVGAELTYNINASALTMAQTIFGSQTTIVRASYTGDSRSSGTYSNGDALSPEATPGNSGIILSTGQVRDFTQSNGDPNRSTSTSTDTSGPNNNALFNALAGTNTYDAAWLDVDFIPTTNVITMQFVFASDEYPEYINTQFNDVVGVWVNGTVVPLAIGNGQISVNNVNNVTTQNLYVNNTNDAYNTEMDGFTVTMSLVMNVNPGVVNSIRIGIADVSDSQFDSNLLISAGGVQGAVIANNDVVELYAGTTKTFNLLANDSGPGASALVITHINGVAVTAGSSVTLNTGQVVTLNADGTITVLADADYETVNFTYTVANGGGSGTSATGIVTLNSIPCFVAGTLIRTPEGERPVEALRPGDLVLTLDDGPQPLRWAGRRSVPAEGRFAPIRIGAGTFGPHRTLLVSPQHRVLIRDSLADLLFGEREVLVAAKDLVNGRSVTVREGGMVEYVHLLFDRHQVVFSDGLATESYLPGPQIADAFERATLDEIRALFPELDPVTGEGYGVAARRMLKGYEAQVLFAAAAAAPPPARRAA
jgi:hypothetical protein